MSGFLRFRGVGFCFDGRSWVKSLHACWRVFGGQIGVRVKFALNPQNNPGAFDCQEPHYTEKWVILHTGRDILTASDYENWWDEDAIRSQIACRLDDFYHTQFPRINEIIVQCLEEYEVERQ